MFWYIIGLIIAFDIGFVSGACWRAIHENDKEEE